MLSQGGVILSLSRIKGFIMGVCWQVLGFLAVMRESVCVCVVGLPASRCASTLV